MMEAIHCIGCGAEIQTEFPEKIGFTPKNVLEKTKDTVEIYCKRCFRLRHYNEIQEVAIPEIDFLHSLQKIAYHKALVVNVVDIFDFNGSLIADLHRFVGKNPVLLVGNKIDLLPKSLNKARLTDWLKAEAKKAGLHVVDVILISAKKSWQIAKMLTKIEQYRSKGDVYVVGVTNVGKSTLINAIIKESVGVTDLITTSKNPGTTLANIEIPLSDNKTLFDTPGIIKHGQVTHFLAKKDLKKVLPKTEIKPKIYQLNSEQTLFLGGLIRLDFLKGVRQSFAIYVSNELKIHRTKLSNAMYFAEKHADDELLQPKWLNTQKPQRYEFSITKPTDLVIAGLGFISLKKTAQIAIYLPPEIDLAYRNPLI